MRVTYVPATTPPPPVPDHDRVLPDATYPVRRDQTADITVSYDSANILHSYDFSLKCVFLILCAARHAGRGRAARIDRGGVLTVYIRIKLHMDLQADKSPVVVKGPFFP
jgi:hypothetical protein